MVLGEERKDHQHNHATQARNEETTAETERRGHAEHLLQRMKSASWELDGA